MKNGRTPAWRRLVSPLNYLRIKHDVKLRFDLGWPLFLATLTVTGFSILPVKPAFFGEHGFFKGVQDVIALFSAFYLVSLAAVSTFSLETLDEIMQGTPPTLDGRALTRREYVCFLFGYLSVLSFLLFLAGVGAAIIAPSLHQGLSSTQLSWIRIILSSAFALGFWNMAVTTLLGIWFLVERVHLRPSKGNNPEQPSNRPHPGQTRRAA